MLLISVFYIEQMLNMTSSVLEHSAQSAHSKQFRLYGMNMNILYSSYYLLCFSYGLLVLGSTFHVSVRAYYIVLDVCFISVQRINTLIYVLFQLKMGYQLFGKEMTRHRVYWGVLKKQSQTTVIHEQLWKRLPNNKLMNKIWVNFYIFSRKLHILLVLKYKFCCQQIFLNKRHSPNPMNDILKRLPNDFSRFLDIFNILSTNFLLSYDFFTP